MQHYQGDCGHCGFVASSISAMQKHMQTHTSGGWTEYAAEETKSEAVEPVSDQEDDLLPDPDPDDGNDWRKLELGDHSETHFQVYEPDNSPQFIGEDHNIETCDMDGEHYRKLYECDDNENHVWSDGVQCDFIHNAGNLTEDMEENEKDDELERQNETDSENIMLHHDEMGAEKKEAMVSETMYSCGHCDFHSSDLKVVQEHTMAEHKAERPVEEEEDNEPSSDNESTNAPGTATSTSENARQVSVDTCDYRIYQCTVPDCSVICADLSEFKSHVKKAHVGVKFNVYYSPYCKYTSTNYAVVQKHVSCTHLMGHSHMSVTLNTCQKEAKRPAENDNETEIQDDDDEKDHLYDSNTAHSASASDSQAANLFSESTNATKIFSCPYCMYTSYERATVGIHISDVHSMVNSQMPINLHEYQKQASFTQKTSPVTRNAVYGCHYCNYEIESMTVCIQHTYHNHNTEWMNHLEKLHPGFTNIVKDIGILESLPKLFIPLYQKIPSLQISKESGVRPPESGTIKNKTDKPDSENLTITNENEMNRDKQGVLLNEAIYPCVHCDFQCLNRRILQEHKMAEHKTERLLTGTETPSDNEEVIVNSTPVVPSQNPRHLSESSNMINKFYCPYCKYASCDCASVRKHMYDMHSMSVNLHAHQKDAAFLQKISSDTMRTVYRCHYCNFETCKMTVCIQHTYHNHNIEWMNHLERLHPGFTNIVKLNGILESLPKLFFANCQGAQPPKHPLPVYKQFAKKGLDRKDGTGSCDLASTKPPSILTSRSPCVPFMVRVPQGTGLNEMCEKPTKSPTKFNTLYLLGKSSSDLRPSSASIHDAKPEPPTGPVSIYLVPKTASPERKSMLAQQLQANAYRVLTNRSPIESKCDKKLITGMSSSEQKKLGQSLSAPQLEPQPSAAGLRPGDIYPPKLHRISEMVSLANSIKGTYSRAQTVVRPPPLMKMTPSGPMTIPLYAVSQTSVVNAVPSGPRQNAQTLSSAQSNVPIQNTVVTSQIPAFVSPQYSSHQLVGTKNRVQYIHPHRSLNQGIRATIPVSALGMLLSKQSQQISDNKSVVCPPPLKSAAMTSCIHQASPTPDNSVGPGPQTLPLAQSPVPIQNHKVAQIPAPLSVSSQQSDAQSTVQYNPPSGGLNQRISTTNIGIIRGILASRNSQNIPGTSEGLPTPASDQLPLSASSGAGSVKRHTGNYDYVAGHTDLVSNKMALSDARIPFNNLFQTQNSGRELLVIKKKPSSNVSISQSQHTLSPLKETLVQNNSEKTVVEKPCMPASIRAKNNLSCTGKSPIIGEIQMNKAQHTSTTFTMNPPPDMMDITSCQYGCKSHQFIMANGQRLLVVHDQKQRFLSKSKETIVKDLAVGSFDSIEIKPDALQTQARRSLKAPYLNQGRQNRNINIAGVGDPPPPNTDKLNHPQYFSQPQIQDSAVSSTCMKDPIVINAIDKDSRGYIHESFVQESREPQNTLQNVSIEEDFEVPCADTVEDDPYLYFASVQDEYVEMGSPCGFKPLKDFVEIRKERKRKKTILDVPVRTSKRARKTNVKCLCEDCRALKTVSCVTTEKSDDPKLKLKPVVVLPNIDALFFV